MAPPRDFGSAATRQHACGAVAAHGRVPDAMTTVGRTPEILDYVETFIFRSDKCFAAFPPN